MSRPIRICLIMHSTRSDNLGVGALTVSEVAILQGIARDLDLPVEIVVLDWKDPRQPYIDGPGVRVVDTDGRFLIRPTGFFAEVRRADLAIDIGAGDSFADIYSQRRLTRIFAMKFLTHLAGTPLVMAPQTVGPFHKPVSAFLARITLRRSRLVATRDALSTAAVREMGITREIVEASDVALRLPHDPPPPRPAGGPVRVGLNISGLLMAGGYRGGSDFGIRLDYPALVSDILHHFLAHPAGCEVHLVPHVFPEPGRRSYNEDDRAANLRLAEAFPQVVLAPPFATPSQAKSYIAGLDFFMGARMHACIAAFSTGVPVVPMAYSRKFAGLFGSLGYHHTVDCTAETQEAIMTRIAAAFENRARLAEEGQTALALGLEKLALYERALAAEIAAIAQRQARR